MSAEPITHVSDSVSPVEQEAILNDKTSPPDSSSDTSLHPHTDPQQTSSSHRSKKSGPIPSIHNPPRTYTVDRKFPCQVPTCSKAFTHPETLRRHLKVHDPNRPKEHPCPLDNCDQAFFTSWEAKQHFVSHTDEKPFACDSCDKSFKRLGDLGSHVKSTHLKKRKRMNEEMGGMNEEGSHSATLLSHSSSSSVSHSASSAVPQSIPVVSHSVTSHPASHSTAGSHPTVGSALPTLAANVSSHSTNPVYYTHPNPNRPSHALTHSIPNMASHPPNAAVTGSNIQTPGTNRQVFSNAARFQTKSHFSSSPAPDSKHTKLIQDAVASISTLHSCHIPHCGKDFPYHYLCLKESLESC